LASKLNFIISQVDNIFEVRSSEAGENVEKIAESSGIEHSDEACIYNLKMPPFQTARPWTRGRKNIL
jgi:hypothetical protein